MKLLSVAVLVLAAGVALVSAAAAEPFVYGAKRDDAPKPEPRVVGTAEQAPAHTTVDAAAWKPSASPRVVANLADPKPVPDKHKSLYHQPRPWVIANLKDPKPKLKKMRADEGVRAHVIVRDTAAPEAEQHTYVRAHTNAADPHVAHTAKGPRTYVLAHSIESDARSEYRKPRKPELVVANAHISADESPRRRSRRVRELVVANAHITADAPRRRRNRKAAPELEVADAHITADAPRRRRAPKRAEPQLESADVALFPAGRDGAPAVRAPKEPKPEREIVSADVKVV